MIRKWIDKYKQWVFNGYQYNQKHLALYRILFSILIIFIIGIPQFSSKMMHFPAGVFNPPPLFGNIFSGIAPLIYFQVTDIIILAGFFFLLIGFFTRISGIITSLLIIINYGFFFSTGKIDHTFMLWFTLFVLSFSGWGKNWSVDSILFKNTSKDNNNWTISLISMTLGFSYFTAGFIKLVSGWLSLSDSMLRAFYLRNYYVQQKQDFLAPLFEHFSFFPFWESGDWFTIIFEIGFLLVIFRPKIFRFFTLLAIFFHGMVLLMMNIGFYQYIVLYFLFWIPLLPQNIFEQCQKIYAKISSNRWLSLFTIILTLAIYSAIILIEYDSYWLKNILLMLSFFMVLSLFIFRPKIIFSDIKKKKTMSIIRFDGVCNLCNGFVQFVINRDKDGIFKFSPLQDTATSSTMDFDSIVLEEDENQLEKSTAFLEIALRLDGFWAYLYLFIIIPKPIRDTVYSFVARNRYRFFGKKDTCMIPTPEMKNRFL